MYQHTERRERREYEIKKSNKIYVSNLNNSVSQDDLRTLFEPHGAIENVTLKHKDTITFAFIEYGKQSEAEAAINSMNGKQVSGQEIKVQYSKGGNDRRNFGDRGGRGGYNNDREGGYNRSNNYQDRPKRDFGDRPRGCFNCGEEGHMIKDCSKPKKPREFNNNREGGFERRGGFNNRGGDGQRSYGGSSRGGSYGGGRSYGGDRQGSGRGGYNSYKRKHSGSRSRSRSNQRKPNRRSRSDS